MLHVIHLRLMLGLLESQSLLLKGDGIDAVSNLKAVLRQNINELGASGQLVSASSLGDSKGEDPEGTGEEPSGGKLGGNGASPDSDGPRPTLVSDGKRDDPVDGGDGDSGVPTGKSTPVSDG